MTYAPVCYVCAVPCPRVVAGFRVCRACAPDAEPPPAPAPPPPAARAAEPPPAGRPDPAAWPPTPGWWYRVRGETVAYTFGPLDAEGQAPKVCKWTPPARPGIDRARAAAQRSWWDIFRDRWEVEGPVTPTEAGLLPWTVPLRNEWYDDVDDVCGACGQQAGYHLAAPPHSHSSLAGGRACPGYAHQPRKG